nr:putative reverse transcriptase domain-containing protein [Tanacetum cinerariifolium]
MTIHNNLPAQVLSTQIKAMKKDNVKAENQGGMYKKSFETYPDGTKCFKNRTWWPNFRKLRDLVMHKSHKSKYSIHPKSDKMYHDLKQLYLWPNMKAKITTYLSKCLTCAKVKDECQNRSDYCKDLRFSCGNGKKITMNIVNKLPKTSSGYDTYGLSSIVLPNMLIFYR